MRASREEWRREEEVDGGKFEEVDKGWEGPYGDGYRPEYL